MESLPDLVMWKIAEYLDGGEVAAWSAVSHRCRNSLNQDVVWQRFCNPQAAEYLSQTECQVKPGFTVPIVQNAGLTDICEARLAFMRQIHLWNNWRNKNCVSYLFPRDWDYFSFYKDNYIVACYRKEEELAIGIWDVKTSPVQICQKTLSSYKNNYCFCVVNNRIVVVQDNILQTFQISISSTKSEIEFEHSFPVEVRRGQVQVFDNLLVSVSKDGRSLKVWDIETGELVRELRSLNTTYSMPFNYNAISNDRYLIVFARNVLNKTSSVTIYLMPDLTEIFKCNMDTSTLSRTNIIVSKYYVFLLVRRTYSDGGVSCYDLKTGEHLFTRDVGFYPSREISMQHSRDNKLFFNSHDYFTSILALFGYNGPRGVKDLVPLDGNYFLCVSKILFDFRDDSERLCLAWVKNGKINNNLYKRPYSYNIPDCDVLRCVVNPPYTKLIVDIFETHDRTRTLLTFW